MPSDHSLRASLERTAAALPVPPGDVADVEARVGARVERRADQRRRRRAAGWATVGVASLVVGVVAVRAVTATDSRIRAVDAPVDEANAVTTTAGSPIPPNPTLDDPAPTPPAAGGAEPGESGEPGGTLVPDSPLETREQAAIAATSDGVLVWGGTVPSDGDQDEASPLPLSDGAWLDLETMTWRPVADATAAVTEALTALSVNEAPVGQSPVEASPVGDAPAAGDSDDRARPVPGGEATAVAALDGRVIVRRGPFVLAYDPAADAWAALAAPPRSVGMHDRLFRWQDRVVLLPAALALDLTAPTLDPDRDPGADSAGGGAWSELPEPPTGVVPAEFATSNDGSRLFAAVIGPGPEFVTAADAGLASGIPAAVLFELTGGGWVSHGQAPLNQPNPELGIVVTGSEVVVTSWTGMEAAAFDLTSGAWESRPQIPQPDHICRFDGAAIGSVALFAGCGHWALTADGWYSLDDPGDVPTAGGFVGAGHGALALVGVDERRAIVAGRLVGLDPVTGGIVGGYGAARLGPVTVDARLDPGPLRRTGANETTAIEVELREPGCRLSLRVRSSDNDLDPVNHRSLALAVDELPVGVRLVEFGGAWGGFGVVLDCPPGAHRRAAEGLAVTGEHVNPIDVTAAFAGYTTTTPIQSVGAIPGLVAAHIASTGSDFAVVASGWSPPYEGRGFATFNFVADNPADPAVREATLTLEVTESAGVYSVGRATWWSVCATGADLVDPTRCRGQDSSPVAPVPGMEVPEPPFTALRWDAAIVGFDTGILVWGGRVPNDDGPYENPLTDGMWFDSATGEWSPIAQPTGADAGGLTGGLARGVALDGNRALIVNGDRAALYDHATDTWSDARLPGGAGDDLHSLVALDGGEVMLLPSGATFTSASRTWSTRASMPGGHTGLGLGRAVSVPGGAIAFPAPDGASGRPPTLRYHADSDTWSSLDPAPIDEAGGFAAPVRIGATVVIANAFGRVARLDLGTGQWVELPRAPFEVRALGEVGGALVVVGGQAAAMPRTAGWLVFDVRTGRILPTALPALGGLVLGGRLVDGPTVTAGPHTFNAWGLLLDGAVVGQIIATPMAEVTGELPNGITAQLADVGCTLTARVRAVAPLAGPEFALPDGLAGVRAELDAGATGPFAFGTPMAAFDLECFDATAYRRVVDSLRLSGEWAGSVDTTEVFAGLTSPTAEEMPERVVDTLNRGASTDDAAPGWTAEVRFVSDIAAHGLVTITHAAGDDSSSANVYQLELSLVDGEWRVDSAVVWTACSRGATLDGRFCL